MTDPNTAPILPRLSLDYTHGTLTNTLTGEQTTEITGVILAYREDRILWPEPGAADPRPVCVNGSAFGPCRCAWADWGPQGEAPECSEELSVLLWLGDQVVVLTARRSYVKTLTQYIEMQNLLGQPLYAQRVTIAMRPASEGSLHRLKLVPGAYLESAELTQVGALAAQGGPIFTRSEAIDEITEGRLGGEA